MTEAEWLACAQPERMTGWNPERMLAALRGRLSQRKMRLFACACGRAILWPRLPPGCRQAVEVVERFADGDASAEQLRAAADAAQALADGAGSESETAAASVVALAAAAVGLEDSLTRICRNTWFAVDESAGSQAVEAAARQCVLICDLLGNPFRPAPLDPGWLRHEGGRVAQIAQAIYDDRELPAGTLDARRLGILADALEDAGCTEPAILEHLRGHGPHVRGCWVVDRLTLRE
jgi:hypothetical protein